MQYPPLIVLGAPESGVTLVGKILQAAGMSVVLPGTDTPLHKFYNELMENCCCDASGYERVPHPESVNSFWDVAKANKAFADVDKSKPWCFCDHRSTLFIQQWLELFQDARILLVVRHPHNVALDMNTLNSKIYVSDAIALWYLYHNRLSNIVDSVHTRVFRFDRLLCNPEVLTDTFNACQSNDLLGFRPEACKQKLQALVDLEVDRLREKSDMLSPLIGSFWQKLRQKCVEIA